MSFSFDAVATQENAQQRLYPELLRPITGLMSTGCHRNVLVGGASRSGKENILGGQGIVKQLITGLFSEMTKASDGEWFSTVSFMQFYPDNSALDLLNPERRSLKPTTHPILGILVEGLCEVVIETAEEALALYEKGRETLKINSGNLHSRCSSVFSVSVERRLRSAGGRDRQYCRSSLRVFDLAGGARKGDLNGVSPLVKVLELMESGETPGNRLLPLLLRDSLAGGCNTFLLYCIEPQGLLDEETPHALALAQRVRGLVTRTAPRHCGKWSPQAAAREIREQIRDLRTKMVAQSECEEGDTRRLEELIRALQVVKDQDWEKRREQSKEIEEKRKQYQARSAMERTPSRTTDQQGETERRTHLQELLREEMEAHLREGRVGVEESQRRVGRIQQLREALREEERRLTDADRESDQSQSGANQGESGSVLLSEVEVEYTKALHRRKRLMEEHQSLIQEELAKMERDLETEKADGPEGEVLRLGRERQVLVLQMEALRREKQEAEQDLEAQHLRHVHLLRSVREESLQVFRVFRQVFEEQGEVVEGRYRTLLLEAIQDAVHLSAQNQQLQVENKQLRRALAQLKDALSVRGDPQERAAVPISQPQ
ncbi:trichohyalin isoform X1 [Anguilla anguilla]|uniref:trichohyalin isoform X1 n=2 Tax=Anguilla anguilla TaxID=7936 RepID=UPI0015AF204D|nr:trichohyalin isoform X1 [Anguilla anguilla]